MTGDDVKLQLRDPVESDFSIFFELLHDTESAHMAAFGTHDADANALAVRLKKAVAAGATLKTIVVVVDDQEEEKVVAGSVSSFILEDKLQVTYWIARVHWGRGIATAALSQLLQLVTVRPIYASAAKDNVASLRVLQKCGFTICGGEKAFASARGEEIDEVFLELTR